MSDWKREPAIQGRQHPCGEVAWLFNPWTGQRRDPRDIGSDPFGRLIAAPTPPEAT